MNYRFRDMRQIGLFFICLILVGCAGKNHQRMEVVKFEALEELMTRDTDKIEVVNFWATWCKPCIKELPYFEELGGSDEGVKVTLVSLDFADEFDKKVKPFVAKNQIESDIILLDEIDYNSWIDKVDPSWSGAIPATLVINHRTGQRKFVEKELEKGEIESIINEISN